MTQCNHYGQCITLVYQEEWIIVLMWKYHSSSLLAGLFTRTYMVRSFTTTWCRESSAGVSCYLNLKEELADTSKSAWKYWSWMNEIVVFATVWYGSWFTWKLTLAVYLFCPCAIFSELSYNIFLEVGIFIMFTPNSRSKFRWWIP